MHQARKRSRKPPVKLRWPLHFVATERSRRLQMMKSRSAKEDLQQRHRTDCVHQPERRTDRPAITARHADQAIAGESGPCDMSYLSPIRGKICQTAIDSPTASTSEKVRGLKIMVRMLKNTGIVDAIQATRPRFRATCLWPSVMPSWLGSPSLVANLTPVTWLVTHALPVLPPPCFESDVRLYTKRPPCLSTTSFSVMETPALKPSP
mmetsp:Transcript_45671/g.74196  ORF Transcript_45671/g.74196 Transcript_45671/m.74196 type:complete len:207 (+) Transcript_45671:706-1326(+)